MSQLTPFYITTAIDYSNDNPHLGTAYEKIGADVIARYKRLCGYHVYFQMGNDEHSQNVKKKALSARLAAKGEGQHPRVVAGVKGTRPQKKPSGDGL